ncbi:hypothetical protein C4553_03315 [Candidatus Parcubacteria bacterium]|nr:MAG: hypothetical protein C4553_03315 [Candidatus Parcubacteria bacterium]
MFRLKNERVWRVFTYLWTIVFMIFVVANFFTQGRYEYLVPPLSAIYTGILGLYVGTKEFDRWYDKYEGRHPGEMFVLIWTFIMLILFGFSLAGGSAYKISSEVVAVYIVVLSIFALTQKSKRLYQRKRVK